MKFAFNALFFLFLKARHGCKEAFLLIEQFQNIPLDVTTPRDSYAWNYRELTTLLALSEGLAEGGFEPLTIRSMQNE